MLNAREKPAQVLCEAFYSLFTCMSHEDFQSIVVPSSVKMLKRNPEIVLESVGILLKSVNLDLSKYATEILLVVLPQVRHADEGRRVGALAIVRSLSQKSSNPDVLEAMFNAVKAVIGGLCVFFCLCFPMFSFRCFKCFVMFSINLWYLRSLITEFVNLCWPFCFFGANIHVVDLIRLRRKTCVSIPENWYGQCAPGIV